MNNAMHRYLYPGTGVPFRFDGRVWHSAIGIVCLAGIVVPVPGTGVSIPIKPVRSPRNVVRKAGCEHRSTPVTC
jgi:hypothetical protein